MKKFLIFIVLLLAIVAGVVYFGLGSINGIVKTQVEQIGSETLGTSVSVGGVNIELLQGVGEITNFAVANPEGFKATDALSFKTVRLDINPESLTSSPIVIDEILLDSVSALYELNAQAKGNLNVLLDQLSAGEETASETSEEGAGSEVDVRIMVKKITVKDTKLALDMTAVGQKLYDETLPTFFAEQVGGASGMTPDQLGPEIARVMLKNITRAAEKKQKDKLKAKLKEKVKDKLGDKLKGVFDKL